MATAILKLDDEHFWNSYSQVELMRVLVQRWAQFNDRDRQNMEARLRAGVPRDFFRPDAFENEDEWISIWDSSTYRRLKRLQSGGNLLSDAS